jgi:hypothetical protein
MWRCILLFVYYFRCVHAIPVDCDETFGHSALSFLPSDLDVHSGREDINFWLHKDGCARYIRLRLPSQGHKHLTRSKSSQLTRDRNARTSQFFPTADETHGYLTQ